MFAGIFYVMDSKNRSRYNFWLFVRELTGWAQINGRDELEIAKKAEYDGEYVRNLKQGGIHALLFDCRCFFGTIGAVLRHDGVVEGGTGS